MFLKVFEITPQTLVSDIVAHDYRTADVFRKHGIEYCCSGKYPIEVACMIKGIEADILITEVEYVTRNLQLPANLPFHQWEIDFLIDHIIYVHHYHLKQILPELKNELEDFTVHHEKNHPHFREILKHFSQLGDELLPHIRQEEEVIFPYLKQVAHAYNRADGLGKLLVRTLRKPVHSTMDNEHKMLNNTIYKFRQLTNNYRSPEKACTEHAVILSKLKALDNELVQHIYLENEVLFPRIIAMEKELLAG